MTITIANISSIIFTVGLCVWMQMASTTHFNLLRLKGLTNDFNRMKEKGEGQSFSNEPTARQKTPPIRELLADFCGYTTAHGLGRLSQSNNTFTRLVWTMFCLGTSTVFVLQVYNLFVIYWSKPVSTVVKVEHESVSFFLF